MSLISKILRSNDRIRVVASGALVVDVRDIVSIGHDYRLPCCRSPFDSQKIVTMNYDNMDRADAKVCAWYEMGNIEGNDYGVLLFEEIGNYLGKYKNQIFHVFTTDITGKPFLLCNIVVNFNVGDWMEPELGKEKVIISIESGEDNQILKDIARMCVRNVWFANSLSTCGNVEFREHNSGVGKKRERQEHKGLVWHRLVIKKSVRGGSGKSSDGETHEPVNRMHLMRGHFKTYTKENPLLGKHTGTWWWSPTVRGDATVGHVIKEYEVQK